MAGEEIEPGDLVEVRRVRAPVADPRDREFWQRAIVKATYTHQVAVEFEDGQRMALQWRHVRPIITTKRRDQ